MYGRFWIITAECAELEFHKCYYGYDESGKTLYKYSPKEGKLPAGS